VYFGSNQYALGRYATTKKNVLLWRRDTPEGGRGNEDTFQGVAGFVRKVGAKLRGYLPGRCGVCKEGTPKIKGTFRGVLLPATAASKRNRFVFFYCFFNWNYPMQVKLFFPIRNARILPKTSHSIWACKLRH